jgi:hypothetical protein
MYFQNMEYPLYSAETGLSSSSAGISPQAARLYMKKSLKNSPQKHIRKGNPQ